MTKEEIQTWQGERLLLRPVREADIDVMLAFRNDPQVYQWMLSTEVEPAEFQSTWLAKADDPRDHAVVADLNGRVIGIGYLDVQDGMGQPGPEIGACEGLIGYILDPDWSGQGYATEIARGLLEIAFARLGLRRVVAGCFADNRASARVLEKIGMRREQYGIADSWHATLGWIDGCTYAVLADEWRAGRVDVVPS